MTDILTSPIQFYRARVAQPPAWLAAASPVVLQMILLSAGGVVTFQRGMAEVAASLPADVGPVFPFGSAVGAGLAVLSVGTGVAVMFWLAAGAVVALDLLFAGSGKARRLIECTALAYWTQVPWSLVSAIVVVVWFDPEPLRLPADLSASEMGARVSVYQAELQSTPLMETMGMIGLYFGIWLVALQAAALRVVSGFSVRGAWAAGILLGTLFVGLPYAASLML